MMDEEEVPNINDCGKGRDAESIRKKLKQIQRVRRKLVDWNKEHDQEYLWEEIVLAQTVHTLRWAIKAETIFSLQRPVVSTLREIDVIDHHVDEATYSDPDFSTIFFFDEKEEEDICSED